MMKKQKEKSKPSAEERTLPLFENKEAPKIVKCDACGDKMPFKGLTQRADGAYECSSCAGPIWVNGASKSVPEASSNEEKASKKPKYKGSESDLEDVRSVSSQLDTRVKQEPINTKTALSHSGTFCAECGTSWPLINGAIWPNCGHTNKGVDDPKKAKKIDPPAGHQRHPCVTRVVVVWAESMYRVAEYCTFRVGPFTDEATVEPGEDPEDVKRRLLGGLKKLASDVFQETFDLYMEKLSIIHKRVSKNK